MKKREALLVKEFSYTDGKYFMKAAYSAVNCELDNNNIISGPAVLEADDIFVIANKDVFLSADRLSNLNALLDELNSKAHSFGCALYAYLSCNFIRMSFDDNKQ